MTFAADSVSATPFRGGSATLNPPLGHSKARERKSFFMYYRGRTMFAPTSKNPSTANIQNKRFLPHPLFLLQNQAQKKKLSKRKRRKKISRSAERDEDSASSTRKPLKRLERNFNGLAKDLLQRKIIESKKAKEYNK